MIFSVYEIANVMSMEGASFLVGEISSYGVGIQDDRNALENLVRERYVTRATGNLNFKTSYDNRKNHLPSRMWVVRVKKDK